MQNRAATILLQLGLIAVVVAALPYKIFELDRYFVPKELILNAVAIIFAVILVARRRAVTIDVVDALLAFFLMWSAASALFATNHWLAQRALGVSVASAVVFWGARRIGASGGYRPLLVAAAFATVIAALTALAQAYGFETDYFSQNRAPGGTFGNRNFVAHICAIGFPALVWSTITAKRPIGALLGSLGAALVAVALVLSRSRAAWLAVAACVVVLAIPLVVSRRYWDRKIIGGRFARLLLAMVIAGTVATILPKSSQLEQRVAVPRFRARNGELQAGKWSRSRCAVSKHASHGRGKSHFRGRAGQLAGALCEIRAGW